MPKVGKEVLSRVICETSLKPWVILWLFELKGSGHQNVLTRSRLAGCMGGSGAKIGCGSQLSPQIHVPIFCSQKSNTCLAPGLRWLSVILVKHIKAIKTHLWQCSKGPFPHLTFLSWDFVTHGTFKTFNNNNKNLSLVLNYKWILFCRKRSEKDFVCLSVESPVSQRLSLVCHILTSLYLPPPPEVLTLTMFLISGNNQSHSPLLSLSIPPLLPRRSWGHKPHGNRLSLTSALSDCWHEKIPSQWKYFPSPNTDIGLHGPTSLSSVG